MTSGLAPLGTARRATGISVALAPTHAGLDDSSMRAMAAVLIVLVLVALIVRGRRGGGAR